MEKEREGRRSKKTVLAIVAGGIPSEAALSHLEVHENDEHAAQDGRQLHCERQDCPHH